MSCSILVIRSPSSPAPPMKHSSTIRRSKASRAQAARSQRPHPRLRELPAAHLLDGYPDLAVRAGADGAHLSGIDAFMAALATLKPARIAGCGRLATRHDAMLAAEAGADYVMFGEPDATGRRPAFDAVAERVAWWAQLSEVPCVRFAA